VRPLSLNNGMATRNACKLTAVTIEASMIGFERISVASLAYGIASGSSNSEPYLALYNQQWFAGGWGSIRPPAGQPVVLGIRIG
jgi:hypothetical protein